MGFSLFDDEKKNYYDILDLNPGASPVDIRQAYFRAKGAYGKDSAAIYSLFDSAEIKAMLDRIEEAYLVLSNLERRREYDRAHGLIQNHFDPLSERSSAQESAPAMNEARRIAGNESTGGNARFFSFNSRAQNAGEAAGPETSAPRGMPAAPMIPSAPSAPATLPVDRPGARRMDIVSMRENYTALAQKFDQELQSGAESGGAFLKKVREAYGVGMQELSDFTKISKLYLTGVEAQDTASLPAGVYVRSFVVQIAKALKLPPDRVATGYMKCFQAVTKK